MKHHFRSVLSNFRTWTDCKKKYSSLRVPVKLIYGEYDHFFGDEAHFIPSIIRQIYEKPKKLIVYGNPDEKRNIIYAGDVIDILLKLLFKDCSPINIGSFKSYKISEIIEKICNLMNFDYKDVIFKEPKNKKIEFEFSLNKMKKNINYLNLTKLDDGLMRTINWFNKKALL